MNIQPAYNTQLTLIDDPAFLGLAIGRVVGADETRDGVMVSVLTPGHQKYSRGAQVMIPLKRLELAKHKRAA